MHGGESLEAPCVLPGDDAGRIGSDNEAQPTSSTRNWHNSSPCLSLDLAGLHVCATAGRRREQDICAMRQLARAPPRVRNQQSSYTSVSSQPGSSVCRVQGLVAGAAEALLAVDRGLVAKALPEAAILPPHAGAAVNDDAHAALPWAHPWAGSAPAGGPAASRWTRVRPAPQTRSCTFAHSWTTG